MDSMQPDPFALPPWLRDYSAELGFAASRSSGAGGQNVNKVNTKVELRFDVRASRLLAPAEKERLLLVWGPKLTGDGELLVVSQEERTQAQNRERAMGKFRDQLRAAFVIPKRRRATLPTKASQERRIESKKRTGQRKAGRQLEEDE